MPDKKITDLVDGGSPQNTDEFVVARAGDNFKLAWSSLSSSQSVQTQNAVDVSVSGNTAGVPALVSSGTLSLAGGNNITLSQVGNAVTISGAAIPAESQTFIAAISASDTLYTSGSVRFTGSQAATVRSGTGQLVVIDVPAQTTQVETQTFIGGVSASDTLYTSGTVRITGVGGGITVSSNTGQRIDLSVAAQSVQPETQTFIGGISASNTLYTSGSVRFTGSNAVTVKSGTGQLVVIDVPTQTTQVETQTFIGGISASDTLYTSGSVRITGVGGGVTVSSNTGQRVDISVAAQSAQTQGILAVGASTGGNTSGDTGVASGTRLVFVGSNNITVSQGTAANATTLTLSGPATHAVQTGISAISNSNTTYVSGTVGLSELGAITIRSTTGQQFQFSVNSQTAQTQGILNAGVSTGGNTSGNTTVNTGTRLVFAGGNNITLSQGTAADATTITISAGAGQFSGGVSNVGQTAGSTGVTGSRVIFVASGDQTLSQSTDANGGTITFQQPYLSGYNPNIHISRGAGQIAQSTLHMQPWPVPRAYVHDRYVMPVFYTQATNSTITVSLSLYLGLYTRNVSTLSMLSSTTGSFSINGSGTASSNQNSGVKNMTFGWTNTVPAGNYWLAQVTATATAGANGTLSNMMLVQSQAYSGLMGIAIGASAQYDLGLGTYSVQTAGMPASIGFNELTGSNNRAHGGYFASQTA